MEQDNVFKMYIYLPAVLFILKAVSIDAAVPTETSVTLEVVSPYVAGDISPGQVLQFEFTIFFMEGLTSDVSIELLPSITETVFGVSKIVSTTFGSNMASEQEVTTNHKGPEYDENSDVWYYSRTVIDLGNVTNTVGSTVDTASSFSVKFEVVYVDIRTNSIDDEYWLSAGVEYQAPTVSPTDYTANEIWIAQVSVTLKGPATGRDPTFTVTPTVTTIALMETVTTTVTMFLPLPSNTITTQALTLNESSSITVLRVYMMTAGPGFDYQITNTTPFATEKYDECPPLTTVDLVFGPLINRAYDDTYEVHATADSNIEVNIDWMFQDPAAIGTVETIGIGVEVNGESIYIYDDDWTLADATTPTAFTTFALDPDTTTGDTISPNRVALALATLAIPPDTNHQYTVSMSTLPLDGHASIISASVASMGNNFYCPTPEENMVFTSTPSSITEGAPVDQASLVFWFPNTGNNPTTDANSNDLVLRVAVLVSPTSVQDSTFDLVVDVNGVQQTLTFTVGAAAEFDTSANYTFDIATKCAFPKYDSANDIALTMTVITEPDKYPGPMTIEFPIPENLTDSNLKVVGGKIISKGKNVVCAQLGDIPLVTSEWGPETDLNDRGVLTIPMMCNVQTVDDAAEDTMVIELTAVLQDKTAVLTADNPEQKVAGGVMFSTTQIYVFEVVVETYMPTDLSSLKEISKFTLEANEILTSGVVEKLKLQYSVDNTVYYDAGVGLESPTGTTALTYPLTQTVLARYVRLINGETGCKVPVATFDSETDTLVHAYGSDASDQIILLNFMTVLDKDNTTCMSLPTNVTSETAPYVWIELKTSLFGLDGSTPFNVTLYGQGFACDNPAGPQITKVMYPINTPSDRFQTGQYRKCKSTSGLIATTCVYECDCTGTQCEDLTLLMMYNGVPAGTYELCDFSVTT